MALYCFIKSANVEINGKLAGKTPLKPVSLKAGSYNIRVFKRGYYEFAEKVTITANKETEVEADLIAFAGWILVKANVKGATVAVDGKLAGKVPLDTDVPAGKREITVQAPGHLPFRKMILITAGKPHPVNVKLAAMPVAVTKNQGSIASKWWFWTIIGAVAAGGAAVGVVLGMQKEPKKGPEPAFQIALP